MSIMNPATIHGARAMALATSVLVFSGCATFGERTGEIERSVAAQQPQAALQQLEKLDLGERDRVLYLMNRGLLERMAGDIPASTKTLEEAKKRIDELYATSVREQTLSFVVNDASKSFAGDEFEQVLVNLYLALNYLERHELEAARVEALQIDVRLREIASQVSESVYTEDAFARYLTGILFEERAEWSDAMISYRQAYEAYRAYANKFGTAMPETLKHDLVRLADKMGLDQEAARYRKEFGIKQTLSAQALRDQGELIFTLHSGLAPRKVENSVTVMSPTTGRLLRLALPDYRARAQPVAYARLTVGGHKAVTTRVEDVEAIAIKTLKARMAGITARALARMAAKDKIAKETSDRSSPLAGLVMNVANTASERADTRSWFLLPGHIDLARLPLAPGRHRAQIELLSQEGHVLQVKDVDIEIRPGAKTYLSHHWVPSYLEARR